MRVVRPYGRTATRPRKAGPNEHERIIRVRDDTGSGDDGPVERDFVEFASSHDALIIAQWISTIDKIATKPTGNKRPTQAQRDLRQKLGDAAWAHIVEHGLLPGLSDDPDGFLKKLWNFKIAPYPEGVEKPRGGKPGKAPREPDPKGRWYARFVGDVPPGDIDASVAAVGRRIHEHLYEAEYRISPDRPKKAKGRIVARAQSIAGNALAPKATNVAHPTWSAGDLEEYERKAGNVAGAIWQAAVARENGHDGARTRRVRPDVAAKVLHAAWADLFDGNPPSFREARERRPGLVDLHDGIRDCYKRTLKRHGKAQKSHGERRRKVSDLLPRSMRALFALVDNTQANRDLSALVRLGKVIHYEATPPEGPTGMTRDAPAHVVTCWPRDVSQSRYWTSDGQAEIKRNEAFVRVWRHVIALATQTLRNWADPQGAIDDDILLAKAIARATGRNHFDPKWHTHKLSVLLGSRSDMFLAGRDDDFQKRTLRLALEGVARLRHNSFHFTGLHRFSQALRLSDVDLAEDLQGALHALWATDIQDRADRLRQTMQGAHLGFYLKEGQNQKLFDAVFGAMNDPDAADVPQPRFRKLLDRASNIAGKGGIALRLPEPANRETLKESPVRHCQYVALKLLYDYPFRSWLALLDPETLNRFIDRAVSRTEEAARGINARRDDEDRRSVITAKARGLGRLAPDQTVQEFLSQLSAETASEMRVQSGYESDPDSARTQADYIEHLRCDVIAQAFDRYLEQGGFLFLTLLAPDAPRPEAPLCDLDGLGHADVNVEVEDWQALLYFLLHLVPVDDVGRLLHQIRKWEILAGKQGGETAAEAPAKVSDVPHIKQSLELYLDMHDAKFEGGAALSVMSEFRQLFESDASFDRVFPQAPDSDDNADDGRLPRRGLREIMRFGHLPVLLPVFRRHPVRDDEVGAVLAAERADGGPSVIALKQEERESLHETWWKNRKHLRGKDRRKYVKALAAVMEHRHSANHVRLVNHVRLHRLMMAVLGRLVDFAGLWERDLYFATLALLYQHGLEPKEALNADGLDKLSSGQIVAVRRALAKAAGQSSVIREIETELARHFGSTSGETGQPVAIRNGFAHFNMINVAQTEGRPPDLTRCVNDARRLMAYDRKLKNAVAHSVIELLKREGLELTWDMEATSSDHNLKNARLATRPAKHLGGLRLYEKEEFKPEGRDKPFWHPVIESLHGRRFVEMVADLFSGTARDAEPDVSAIPLDRIDWTDRKRFDKGRFWKPKHAESKAHPGRAKRNQRSSS